MLLPESTAVPVQSLSRIFSDMSESYKIFWFRGILDIAMAGKDTATFNEIIRSMVRDAWYMVAEYHLNLGPSDTLEKLVREMYDASGLKSSAGDDEIKAYLEMSEKNSDDYNKDASGRLRTYESVLSRFVPYRLQAPFLKNFKGTAWDSTEDVIEHINSDNSVIYHIGPEKGLDRTIHIRKDWMEYLTANQAIVSGWVNYHLICYLQKRNPSVPGISDKLHPPAARNMEKAKKFWKAVAAHYEIPNIYTIKQDILKDNEISLDHFVPWSYVANDELWNLVPTTKSINSGKGNNLPEWDFFFPLLCNVEYRSYCAIWENQDIRGLFSKCEQEHVNSNEAREKLYKAGIGQEDFSRELSMILEPVYQGAKNLGFAEWNRDK